jgi:hypothetical protein
VFYDSSANDSPFVERVRPDAVQLRDFGFAEFSELLQSINACSRQRAARRGG